MEPAGCPALTRRLAAAALLAALALLGAFLEAAGCPGAAPLEPPSPRHPLGGGPLGGDGLCLLLAEAPGSLSVLASATAAALAVLAASAFAGAAGLDWAVNAAARLSSSLPRLGLAALLAAAAEPGGVLLGAVLGVLLSQPHASSVAAEARRLSLEGYSEASIAAGASRLHVARRHVLPALAPAAARYAAMVGASALYAATGLQAVGLGSPQDATWGSHVHLILSTPGAAATAAGALQLAAALALTAASAVAVRAVVEQPRPRLWPPLGWLLA